MRQIRNCESSRLTTGVSKCTLDMGKVVGAILVHHGQKLPIELTGEKLRELCHEDVRSRIYPITPFAEYGKNGGEPQVNTVGYAAPGVGDVSARTDALTMDKFYPELNASLLRNMNIKYDVYFFDAKKVIYGMNDGTDTLAGFPMSTIYPTAVPHPTSSNPASLIINFAYEDARESMEQLDYIKLDFDPRRFLCGLTAVILVKTEAGNDYKLIEKVGGYDLTPLYGSLIATKAADIFNGATAATYNVDAGTLTITAAAGKTPSLKSPKELFEAGIEGIEQI